MKVSEIKKLPFFKDCKHRKKNSVFLYIILVYDLQDGLKDERDLEERKKQALEETKLPVEEKWVKQLMECHDDSEFSEMIDYFIAYQMNDEWSFLIAQRQLYHTLMKEIRSPKTDTKARTEASKNADAIMGRIKRLEHEIYGGDDETLNSRKVYRKTKLEQFVKETRTE